jgi:cytochrome c oxidase subunit 2
VSGGPLIIADTRNQFGHLFTVYEWVMIVVAAIVFALVLFAVFRFRRRDDTYPRGKSKAPIAESVYAVVLAVVAAALVTLTFQTEDRIDPVSGHPDVRIRVTAFQWQWRFDYPSGKSVIGTTGHEPTLVVPVDERVEIELTSRDVIHSFWIASERFKRDAFPKRVTRFDLRFDRVGTHLGRCAEFCGLRHTNMNFYVRVVPKDEFRRLTAAG